MGTTVKALPEAKAETTETKQELVPAQTQQASPTAFGLTPRTFEEAWRFAKMIAMSELAPRDFRGKPENIMVAMQMGAEVGLSPMAAIQNIAVINGRPSLWGDAALAVVQNHPHYEWHREWLEGSGEEHAAVFVIKRKRAEPHTSRFSIADARKAHLWGKEGPWQNYPDRMLQMRARSFGMRDKFPDALRGLITVEEASDIPPDVGPSACVTHDLDAAAASAGMKAEQELQAKLQKEKEAEEQRKAEAVRLEQEQKVRAWHKQLVESGACAAGTDELGYCKLQKGHTGGHQMVPVLSSLDEPQQEATQEATETAEEAQAEPQLASPAIEFGNHAQGGTETQEARPQTRQKRRY